VYDRRTIGLLRAELGRYDVIVNSILWDVFRTDHLIYREDLSRMRSGSMIVDISCDDHMGIETSRATTIDDPVFVEEGILHYSVSHTPALLYKAATRSISEVVCRFVEGLVQEKRDPILQQATILEKGVIRDERIRRFQGR
jgi:N5-(carboxyethyl)ornithine synthase